MKSIIKRSFFILIFAEVLFLSGIVSGIELIDQDTCRCPGGVISIGDQRYNVLEKCGKPTAIEDWGDRWMYDRGPDEFILYITFVNDLVERIQNGGYGMDYGQTESSDKKRFTPPK